MSGCTAGGEEAPTDPVARLENLDVLQLAVRQQPPGRIDAGHAAADDRNVENVVL
jgi:hypothetical protein